MNRLKFRWLFLLTAWIIFIGTGRNIYASIMLILAGLYQLTELIPNVVKYMREVHYAKRKS